LVQEDDDDLERTDITVTRHSVENPALSSRQPARPISVQGYDDSPVTPRAGEGLQAAAFGHGVHDGDHDGDLDDAFTMASQGSLGVASPRGLSTQGMDDDAALVRESERMFAAAPYGRGPMDHADTEAGGQALAFEFSDDAVDAAFASILDAAPTYVSDDLNIRGPQESVIELEDDEILLTGDVEPYLSEEPTGAQTQEPLASSEAENFEDLDEAEELDPEDLLELEEIVDDLNEPTTAGDSPFDPTGPHETK
jgi:hypothetical protein